MIYIYIYYIILYIHIIYIYIYIPIETTQRVESYKAGDSGLQNSGPTTTPINKRND